MQKIFNNIIRSKRKSLSLKINKNGELIVQAPTTMSMKTIEDFITQKQNWILKKQKLIQEIRNTALENRKLYANKILFLGQYYKIEYVLNKNIPITFSDKFYIHKKYENNFYKKLSAWNKEQAKKIIHEILYTYKNKHKLNFGKVRIGGAKRILGSCKTTGDLSFSQHLLLAPIKIIEYICVHELAHLKHHNHSKLFWQEVAVMMPDYKIHKTWLKQNYFSLIE